MTTNANSTFRRKYRIAYLVSHPIQYQAPLLRLIAAQPDMDLTVFFQTKVKGEDFHDPGFGRRIKWDIPLLEGYNHEFLPAIGRNDIFNPWSYGIVRRLRRGNFDVLWVHGYARWFNWIAMAAARLTGIRVLVRDDPNAISTPRSRTKTWLKRLLFFRGLRLLGDGFLAIGSLNKQYYLENDIPASRIFLMPYCVDNNYFADLARAAAPQRESFRQRLGLTAGRPIILYASKLVQLKHAGDLLHAFEKVCTHVRVSPRPYVLFVGDGETRNTLETMARPMADDVRFLGFCSQSELPAFFDLCDVFVLPSERDNWGLVVNEVMSVGRAVIVSDRVGCAPDLVHNGINGYVYPMGDIDALAIALKNVLQSRETITAMGAESAERIKSWSFQQDIEVLRVALNSVTTGRSNKP